MQQLEKIILTLFILLTSVSIGYTMENLQFASNSSLFYFGLTSLFGALAQVGCLIYLAKKYMTDVDTHTKSIGKINEQLATGQTLMASYQKLIEAQTASLGKILDRIECTEKKVVKIQTICSMEHPNHKMDD